jgi:hypothetical protein
LRLIEGEAVDFSAFSRVSHLQIYAERNSTDFTVSFSGSGRLIPGVSEFYCPVTVRGSTRKAEIIAGKGSLKKGEYHF